MRRPAFACLLVLLGTASPSRAQSPGTDLCLEKTVDAPDAILGREATFFIAVTNVGLADATGIAVADVLPEGLAFAAADASAGAYDAATGTWTLDALAPGRTATLALTTIVTAEVPVENCAALHALDQHDWNPENDADCAAIVPAPAEPAGLAARLGAW